MTVNCFFAAYLVQGFSDIRWLLAAIAKSGKSKSKQEIQMKLGILVVLIGAIGLVGCGPSKAELNRADIVNYQNTVAHIGWKLYRIAEEQAGNYDMADNAGWIQGTWTPNRQEYWLTFRTSTTASLDEIKAYSTTNLTAAPKECAMLSQQLTNLFIRTEQWRSFYSDSSPSFEGFKNAIVRIYWPSKLEFEKLKSELLRDICQFAG